MTTIYVLTEGEYSDYRIVALYSTLELAQAAQKHCPDSRIEEYELDAIKIPEHPPGYTAWIVSINTKINSIYYVGQADSLFGHFEPKEVYYEGGGHDGELNTLQVHCWARNEEHSRKIALDKFYQWKYEREMGFLENDTEAQ